MSQPRPIPDALLEKYVAGALTGDALARVERAVAESPSEKARVDALRADSAAFLISHPPGPLASRLEQPKRRWRFWLPLAAVATAALAVFVVREAPEDESTVKGTLVFSAFRQRENAAAEELVSGAIVKPGDRIRFSVRTPADGFVAVLSRDGAGHASVYSPFSAPQAAPHSAKDTLLPGAVMLDEAPGTERVWALFSPRAFELGPLLQQLERGEKPSAPGLSAAFVEWKKE
jgi:hypothetical protein